MPPRETGRSSPENQSKACARSRNICGEPEFLNARCAQCALISKEGGRGGTRPIRETLSETLHDKAFCNKNIAPDRCLKGGIAVELTEMSCVQCILALQKIYGTSRSHLESPLDPWEALVRKVYGQTRPSGGRF